MSTSPTHVCGGGGRTRSVRTEGAGSARGEREVSVKGEVVFVDPPPHLAVRGRSGERSRSSVL